MNRANFKINIGLLALPILMIDIILLPVSPVFSLPFSMVIVAYFFVRYYNKSFFEKRLVLMIFVLSLIISTIISVLFKENYIVLNNVISYTTLNVHVEDFKRCIYLLMGLAIYRVTGLLYLNYYYNVDKHINKILLIVCCSFIIMAIIFNIDINLFYKIKGFFFNVDVNMLGNAALNNAGYLNRFSFILLDPNNAGYYILIICIYLLENANLKEWTRIGIWMTILAAPFLTMSNGVLYTSIIYVTLKMIKIMYGMLKGKLSKKVAILIAMAIFLITLYIFIGQFTSNNLFNMFVEKQSITLDRWSSNSIDSRLDIYKSLISENIYPPIIGDGYIIIKKGIYIKPHSDHLRILYSYGILAYLALLVLIIKKRIFNHKYLFLIPAFVAFSINSLIDETRILFTFLILFAITNAKFVSLKRKVLE